MKKLMLFIAVYAMLGVSRGEDPLFNTVQTTLLEHVSPATQVVSGATNVSLMDSVILIGKVNGASIFDIQAGYTQDVTSDKDGAIIGSGFFKVSSFLKDKIKLKDEWLFLNSVEHGPFYAYNFKEHRGFGGYQFALAFSLNPVK